MEGFYLLIGHLIGDYIVQNDWMAANKTNPYPGKQPTAKMLPDGSPVGPISDFLDALNNWDFKKHQWWRGNLACTVHCLLYTLAVWACSFWWMPVWGIVTVFVLHWPIDRFRLAGRWMRNISGQTAFASGALSPWSVIVVDNIAHIVTLGAIAAICGR